MSNLKENRYKTRFAKLKAEGKKAYIPFTMLGWPNADQCFATIETMINSQVAALELGIAFSDPVADGPVIQQAANETINAGFTVNDAFALVQRVRTLDANIPIGLLVYYNMVMARGVDQFFADAALSGADGVLIVDLPAVEAQEVMAAAASNGIELIFIVSPLTSEERLKTIVKHAGGFLYAVSRLGITGVEERYDSTLPALIERVRQTSQLPVCIGFGVSNPEQAASMIALGADGVITGSKIIDLVRQTDANELAEKLEKYLQSMLLAIVPSVKLTV